ncbi:MAG: hypothetical protein HZA07_02195 [Nitrospirae bacterium]|nr:hypothetical protein [Nitrospirota bacterium]
MVNNHLYIFGAGSSKDFGFPLGNEFFEKAHILSASPQEKTKSIRHIERNLKAVEKILRSIFHNLPDEHEHWPNFEELFSLLHALKSKGELNITENDIKKFVALIFHTLSACHFMFLDVNGIKKFSYYKDFISNILKNAKENPSFINLNYDYLLDAAIEEVVNDNSLNAIPQNYKIDLYNVSNCEKITQGRYILIKPHGSLKIAKCNKCEIFFYVRDTFVPRIDNKRTPCPKCNESITYSHLIPPTYFKNVPTLIDAHEIIKLVSNAHKITIIGYSFPPYDIEMKYLIFRGLFKNKKDVLFKIIDFDEDNDVEKVRNKYKFLQLFTRKKMLFNTEGFLMYLKHVNS